MPMRGLIAGVMTIMAAPAPAQLAPVPVRSISIEDGDFTDLVAVGRAIGRSRIVFLGEATHGDGASVQAKARLVRYLHEWLGFDVLAFESGFYELGAAERAVRAGAKPSAMLPKAVFPVWSEAEQFAPLMAWLDANRAAGKRPMALAGIDFQRTGALGDGLAVSLRAASADRSVGRFADAYEAMRTRDPAFAAIDPAALIADGDAAAAAIGAWRHRDRKWLAQVARSTGRFLAFARGMTKPTSDVFNSRDRQMAENLAWLADGPYRGRKIIVWGATSHLMRERTGFAGDATAAMVPLGAPTARRFGDDLYVLAVTSGGGAIGSVARRTNTDVGAPPAGSLEAELAARGSAYGFASLPRDWRGTSWMLGYQSMLGPWGRSVDGVFFIARQTPTRYPPPAAGAK